MTLTDEKFSFKWQISFDSTIQISKLYFTNQQNFQIKEFYWIKRKLLGNRVNQEVDI